MYVHRSGCGGKSGSLPLGRHRFTDRPFPFAIIAESSPLEPQTAHLVIECAQAYWHVNLHCGVIAVSGTKCGVRLHIPCSKRRSLHDGRSASHHSRPTIRAYRAVRGRPGRIVALPCETGRPLSDDLRIFHRYRRSIGDSRLPGVRTPHKRRSICGRRWAICRPHIDHCLCLPGKQRGRHPKDRGELLRLKISSCSPGVGGAVSGGPSSGT